MQPDTVSLSLVNGMLTCDQQTLGSYWSFLTQHILLCGNQSFTRSNSPWRFPGTCHGPSKHQTYISNYDKLRDVVKHQLRPYFWVPGSGLDENRTG